MRRLLSLTAPLALGLSACSEQVAPAPMVSQVSPLPGTFELCILANEDDDGEAIAKAERYFQEARTNPRIAADLKQRAEANEPPPAPVAGEGLAFFVLGEECTYRWAPAADVFLRNNQVRPVPHVSEAGHRLYTAIRHARLDGIPYAQEGSVDGRRTSQVWWSRERPGTNDADYFLLVRVESKEQAVQTEEVTFTWDPADRTEKGGVFLAGRLDSAGTDKLAGLTTRNQPGDRTLRKLAILIQGKVITAPTLNEPVTQGRFLITFAGGADVDVKDMAELVAALRGN